MQALADPRALKVRPRPLTDARHVILLPMAQPEARIIHLYSSGRHERDAKGPVQSHQDILQAELDTLLYGSEPRSSIPTAASGRSPAANRHNMTLPFKKQTEALQLLSTEVADSRLLRKGRIRAAVQLTVHFSHLLMGLKPWR